MEERNMEDRFSGGGLYCRCADCEVLWL